MSLVAAVHRAVATVAATRVTSSSDCESESGSVHDDSCGRIEIVCEGVESNIGQVVGMANQKLFT